ncbi:hypothetical protein HY229_02900 [Candidatus Acetothermia bacterium]|nr:hypothetical protein [Candidatus Acetothermia bacterium]MBI3643031.1 hypothetical protein [Candidatus Acetothermia bacterium]
MIRPAFGISLGVAALSLILTFAASGAWAWAAILFLYGVLWWYSEKSKKAWVPSVGLLLFTGMAASGMAAGLAKESLLLGAVMTLAAWDLDLWRQRASRASRQDNLGALMRPHLERLALVLALGYGVSWLVLSVRMELGFWWIFILAFAGVIALAKALGALQQESD